MRKISLLTLLAVIAAVSALEAQTNTFPITGAAGIGTLAPNSSSLLEIKSTSKGLLIPRMTKNQRDAIVAPATGLMIYQTNSTPGFYYYSSTEWTPVTPRNKGWSLNGNAGTVAGTNFIGTTDAQPLVFKVNNTQAGYVNPDSLYSNSVFGYQSLPVQEGFGRNTAVGLRALYHNTYGSGNTANGSNSLYLNTEGHWNTAAGFWALSTNTTGAYNSCFGAFADVGSENLTSATAIGDYAIVDESEKVRVGNVNVTSIGGAVGWTSFSDGRYKKNIKEDVKGLSFINSLKPITYTVDINKLNTHYDKNRKHDDAYDKTKKEMQPAADEASKIVYNGFMAQDVEAAAKKLNYNFSGVDKPKTEDGLYGLRYSDFVVPLVKAVQELSKMNDTKDAKIDAQDKKINDQQKQIDDLKAMMLQIQQNLKNCTSCAGNPLAQQSKIVSVSNASLEQNIPNPFNHVTTINYNLPQQFSSAKIIVTDKSGKPLKQINLSAGGKGSLNVDASTLASGAYQYSLYVDGRLIGTKQMVVAR